VKYSCSVMILRKYLRFEVITAVAMKIAVLNATYRSVACLSYRFISGFLP
jgi:hypothetical protein